MSFFAEQVKSHRVKSGMSMQALAEKASVSKSMICKIERDEVQPTLDVAGKIAKALGKTLSEMLHVSQPTSVVFLPKEKQAIWEDAHNIKRRNISPIFEGLKIEWLLVDLPPAQVIKKTFPVDNATYTCGEKFILVKKGQLEIRINEQVFVLKVDDSIFFEANCSHEIINSSNEHTEFFVVVRHPS